MKRDKRGRRNPARPDIHVTALASQLEISASYLSRLLNGYIEHPGLELSLKLAPALGVPVEKLPDLLKLYKQRRENKGLVHK